MNNDRMIYGIEIKLHVQNDSKWVMARDSMFNTRELAENYLKQLDIFLREKYKDDAFYDWWTGFERLDYRVVEVRFYED